MRSPARLAFALILLGHLYFWARPAANANARYDQIVSIAVHGELHIDRYVANTIDWSLCGGHFYPTKPPGLVLLGVPVYFALYHAERLFGLEPLDADSGAWQANHKVLVAVLNGLLVAIAAMALARIATRLGLRETTAVLASLAWGLGTLVFPFSLALFSHAHVAALLLLAIYFVVVPASAVGRWRFAAAGALCGLAALSDYTAAFAVVALAACAWDDRRSPRDVAAFCAGGLPALVAMLAYHAACFGSPWTTAQAHVNPEFLAPGATGLAGQVEVPPPTRPLLLLASPYRGLFFFSPVLLLAFAGVGPLWRSGRRALAVASLAVPAALVAVNCLWRVWHGGASAGPRFLVPAIAFLVVPAVVAFERLPHAAAVLGGVSLAHALAIAAVQLLVPESDRNPLFSHVYPHLARGVLDHENVGSRLGLRGHVSLLPYVLLAAPLIVALVRALRARAEEPR
jgi:hypothetical protein